MRTLPELLALGAIDDLTHEETVLMYIARDDQMCLHTASHRSWVARKATGVLYYAVGAEVPTAAAERCHELLEFSTNAEQYAAMTLAELQFVGY